MGDTLIEGTEGDGAGRVKAQDLLAPLASVYVGSLAVAIDSGLWSDPAQVVANLRASSDLWSLPEPDRETIHDDSLGLARGLVDECADRLERPPRPAWRQGLADQTRDGLERLERALSWVRETRETPAIRGAEWEWTELDVQPCSLDTEPQQVVSWVRERWETDHSTSDFVCLEVGEAETDHELRLVVWLFGWRVALLVGDTARWFPIPRLAAVGRGFGPVFRWYLSSERVFPVDRTGREHLDFGTILGQDLQRAYARLSQPLRPPAPRSARASAVRGLAAKAPTAPSPYERFPAHADPAVFGQFIDWLRGEWGDDPGDTGGRSDA